MKRALAAALDVRPGEGRLVALLFAHSFCIGVPRVLTSTAAMALFLAQLGAAELPYVYIGAAAALPLTGYLRLRVAERLPLRRLLILDLSLVLVALLGLRVALGSGAGFWVAVLLPVWYEVEWVLLNLEFWGLAGQLLDVRQGRRLFGPIGTGELAAGALAGFAVPWLVAAVGTANLLLCSAFAVLAGLGVLGATLRLHPAAALGAAPRGEVAGPGRGVRVGELLRRRYAWLLFQLVALSYLGYYVLDNIFYTAAQARLPDQEQLASFLGLFWACVSVVTLVCRAFLSPRVLARLGLLGGLVTLPVAVGVATLGVWLGGALPAAGVAVFLAVAASRFLDQVLRESVDQSAVMVLYQPLPGAQRVGAQTAVESIVGPLAGGVAGLALVAAIKLLGFGIPELSLLLAALVAAWIAAAARVRGEYTRVLASALATRRLVGQELALGDASSLSVLKRGLESPHPGEVAYCLDVLEELQHPDLAGCVTGLFGHLAAGVRRDALLRVERLGLSQALWAVRESESRERSPGVLAAALRALAAVGDAEDVETVLARVDDPDREIRTGARVALLRNGGIEGVLAAGQRLMQQAHAAEPGSRAEAARLIGEVGVPSFYRPLLALARDPDPEVRRAALYAAGRLANPRLWPLALDALPDPRFRSAAASALRSWGGGVVPLLETAFERAEAEGDRSTRRRLARLSGQIRSERSLRLLWGRIDDADPSVRQSVLATLVLSGDRPAAAERPRVEARITAELAGAAAILGMLEELGGGGSPSPSLPAALEAALDGSRDRVLSLLALLHPSEPLQRARVNLTSRMPEKRAQAVELIESVLPRQLAERVVPLVERRPHAVRLERLAGGRPALPRGERIGALALGSGADELGAWCRACALVAIAEERLLGLEPAVLGSLDSSDPLVRDSAAWAAARLGLEPGAADAALRGRLKAFAGSGEGGEVLSTVEKVIILKSVEIFSETPDDVLAEIAPLLEEVSLEAEQVVFEKGDMGSALYVLIDGRVRVHDGSRTLRELGPRDIFGEMAALDPEPRSASVTALEPTRLFRLEQEALYDLMADRIEVVRGVIRVLCHRLRVRG